LLLLLSCYLMTAIQNHRRGPSGRKVSVGEERKKESERKNAANSENLVP
jgi:hypothetical protein